MIRTRYALLICLMALALLSLLNCGGPVDGAILMKDITLTCTAPSATAGMAAGQCDEYIAYYSTNPLDFKNKPLSALSTVKASNRPAPAGQADTIRLRHLFPTGRTVYYKVVAAKYVWLSPTSDTTRADSTLTVLTSDTLSNFASRFLPPEQNEKPTVLKISDAGGGFDILNPLWRRG